MGFVIDLAQGPVEVLVEKLAALQQQMLDQTSKSTAVHVKHLISIVGRIISMGLASEPFHDPHLVRCSSIKAVLC